MRYSLVQDRKRERTKQEEGEKNGAMLDESSVFMCTFSIIFLSPLNPLRDQIFSATIAFRGDVPFPVWYLPTNLSLLPEIFFDAL